jgi:hypothetical protein
MANNFAHALFKKAPLYDKDLVLRPGLKWCVRLLEKKEGRKE